LGDLAGTLRGLSYLAASMLFILSLRGLSTQESARRGNAFGTFGMALAVLVTAVALLLPGASNARSSGGELSAIGLLGGALAIGCAVGALLASRVAMTSMPELVAMLHSFVGAAAVLVGIATYLQPGVEIAVAPTVHMVEIFVGVLIGAVAGYVDNYYTESVAQYVANDLRQRVYHHLQRLSLKYYDTHQIGNMLSTITSDVGTIQSFASTALLSILVDSLTIIGMVGVMLYLNWDFALVAVGVTPFLLLFVWGYLYTGFMSLSQSWFAHLRFGVNAPEMRPASSGAPGF